MIPDADGAYSSLPVRPTCPSISKRVLVSIFVCAFLFLNENNQTTRTPSPPRIRRSVKSIFRELGPYNTRRAYRMKEATFWELHRRLYKKMKYNARPPSSSKKKCKNGARNGLITSPTRLSCAIRYFAGGSPYDIAIAHGVSVRSVFVSVWRVVDAVNNTPTFDIIFPNHDQQQTISERFKAKSIAGFDGVVGCIDGMLLWIEQPTKADCAIAGVGPKKFFCGRKKKFGLNLSATVDDLRRFIDVDISHPGATSDYLAFAVSSLKRKLDVGLLAEGKYIFGDNAYVNSIQMVTPYKSPNRAKDNYNFYHSQLRITVECAFGILVHRWSILRRPMPQAMGIHKITAMTVCLCKLHNFLIDERVGSSLHQDKAYGMCRGSVPMEKTHAADFDDTLIPEQLLHGGEHMDDIDTNEWRRATRINQQQLPRDLLFNSVCDQGLVRPTPKHW